MNKPPPAIPSRENPNGRIIGHNLMENKPIHESFKLKSAWCNCGNEEFHSYPGDGECSCGTHKHHVHCVCGGVTQIG